MQGPLGESFFPLVPLGAPTLKFLELTARRKFDETPKIRISYSIQLDHIVSKLRFLALRTNTYLSARHGRQRHSQKAGLTSRLYCRGGTNPSWHVSRVRLHELQ